jgi:hypothetical protein
VVLEIRRKPFSTPAIWVAWLIGTLWAVAWLVHRNRIASATPRKGVALEALVWFAALVEVVLLQSVPPDPISRWLISLPFGAVIVGGWLFVSSRSAVAAPRADTPQSPLWHALLIALVARFALLGVLEFVGEMQRVVSEALGKYDS